MTKALVPLADGVEEMEAVIIIDTLRRAGWEVVSASVSGSTITASRGIKLVPDTLWEKINPAHFDVLVLPGGAKGTSTLSSDKRVLETVRSFVKSNKIVAAICAAPLVLQVAGVLDNKKATCHPAVRNQLKSCEMSDERVVMDGSIITSRGPGTSFEFALAIIRHVDGDTAANKVAEGLVL